MPQAVQHTWAFKELARIEALPKADLIFEVHNIMNGYTYSWRSIQRKLCELDIDHSLHVQWDDLRSIKHSWESYPSLTRERRHEDIVSGLFRDAKSLSWDPKFLRTLLLNLRLILIRAGLEENEAIELVSENRDRPTKVGLEDLWINCKRPNLRILGKEWSEEDTDDEKSTLLKRVEGRERTSARWWKKWFSF